MTAIFMSFSRAGKRSSKRKTEITGKYNRKALVDGWMEKKDGEITEDNLDWEKEADMDAALDFADSF